MYFVPKARSPCSPCGDSKTCVEVVAGQLKLFWLPFFRTGVCGEASSMACFMGFRRSESPRLSNFPAFSVSPLFREDRHVDSPIRRSWGEEWGTGRRYKEPSSGLVRREGGSERRYPISYSSSPSFSYPNASSTNSFLTYKQVTMLITPLRPRVLLDLARQKVFQVFKSNTWEDPSIYPARDIPLVFVTDIFFGYLDLSLRRRYLSTSRCQLVRCVPGIYSRPRYYYPPAVLCLLIR